MIFTDGLTVSPAWIAGLLAVSAMAFFLGCVGCWQHKSHGRPDHRPAPPTPDSEYHPRYQTDLYPPTPVPSSALNSQPITEDNDNDYEEDFEDLTAQNIPDQLSQRAPNSVPSQKYTRVTTVSLSMEGEGMAPLPESPCHSYENVVSANESLAAAPVMRKDHTYLEVFPSSENELELPTADKVTAMRSSVESEGKVSMLSQSSRHSYENVVHTNGSPSSASDLEGDYVNLRNQ